MSIKNGLKDEYCIHILKMHYYQVLKIIDKKNGADFSAKQFCKKCVAFRDGMLFS